MIVRNIREMAPFPGASTIAIGIIKLNSMSCVRVIAAYDSVKQWLQSEHNLTAKDIEVINHGVDLERFHPVDQKRAREQLGFASDTFVVGYVGSFKSRHRLDLLIESIASLRAEGYMIEAVLVGKGEQREEFISKIEDNGLEMAFRFPGYISDDKLKTYIGACDLLYGVRDDDHWSNPMKVYESLACNRPVIALKTEHTTFIEERDYGILVDNSDIADVKNGIEAAYKRLVETGNSFNDSQKYIAKRHSWDQHAAAIVEAWEQTRPATPQTNSD